ncbi:HEXXH motif domain-containing protein [Nocardia gipuzkoensis]|uniref:HEXXH motif domain-containing protein n=1 Tax=Nocardia gipuzkoensis TaxID=2749991 RepID=UPI00237DE34C|nr:HEXXH motif domain-containing protein [Nocardia gipuzkoensis]MDE1672617.1 HEXXH motif domain-containing protein [Nocardia gipuzkoensis]
MTHTDTSNIETAIREIGSGYGTDATIAALAEEALRGRLILLRALLAKLAAERPDDFADVESAHRSLRDLPQADSDSVAELLTYPHVGNWLTSIFRRLNFTDYDAAHPIPLWADLGYLGWLAASGQIVAGRPGAVQVVVRSGVVMLPLIGMARLGDAAECGHCSLSWSADGELTFVYHDTTLVVTSHESETTADWLPLRCLDVDDSAYRLYLDDLDPFRDFDVKLPDFFKLPPDLLDVADASSWAQHFRGAWQMLRRDFAQYHAPMRAGLRVVVPLTAKPEATGQSWTSPTGYGAVYSTAPEDSCQLALTLIHEFQHAKFSLLADQAVLFEPDMTARFYAPWRVDPRPIYGLMHGIYAFFGVTDFWRVHRRSNCHRNMRAEMEFECGRLQVATALEQVMSSGVLTPSGEKFLTTLSDSMASWQFEDISAKARDIAADVSICLKAFWRVRNLKPPSSEVAALADRWLHGSPSAGVLPPGTIVDQDGIPTRYNKLTLPHMLTRHSATCAPQITDDGSGDSACIIGNFEQAAARYVEQLRQDQFRPQTWTGLALVLPQLHAEADLSVLRERTEIVAHVYCALADRGVTCDIVDLVHWLTRY